MKTYLLILSLFFVFACNSTESVEEITAPVKVELQTSYGNIVLELSDKTPLHKDNFIKLVNEGVYDSLLFHRVIEGFVVQGGDPESKYATPADTIGGGGLDYRVPAEFDTTLFHQKGAVGAARNNNPDRESSPIQFYFVQAGAVADSSFAKDEERINKWLGQYYTKHAPENKMWLDSLYSTMENENWESFRYANDTINKLAETFTDFEQYVIPEEHKEIYRTAGGTPFLDQNYTVFAQVISGLDVVDSIAAVPTNDLDRPLEDVRILSAKVLKD